MTDTPSTPPVNDPDPATPPKPPNGRDPVPWERFQEVVAAKNAASAQVAEAKAEAQRYAERAAVADTLAKTLKESEARWAAERAGLEEDVALVGAGLSDDDARAVARTLYGRLPAATRPKSIGEWLGGLKAEGADVPKALSPYLAPPAAPAAPAKSPAPRQPAAPALPPAAPQEITAEALNAAAERVRKGLPGAMGELQRLMGRNGVDSRPAR